MPSRLRWTRKEGEIALMSGRKVLGSVYLASRGMRTERWCFADFENGDCDMDLRASNEQAACHEAYCVWRLRLTMRLNEVARLLRMAPAALPGKAVRRAR